MRLFTTTTTIALLALSSVAQADQQSFSLEGTTIVIAQAGTPASPDSVAAPADHAPTPTMDKASDTAPAAAPAAEEASAPEVQAGDLIAGAQKTATDWQKLGLLGGLIALVNLLINALKFGPIKEWMEVNKKRWLIPYIALGLGGALGVMSAIYTGSDPVQSLMAGLAAGSSAIGVHEATTKLKKGKRTA